MTTRNCEIYVSIGSNIDPKNNVIKSLIMLKKYALIKAVSTFYWNPSFNRPEQPQFLNGVIEIECEAPAYDLKFSVLRRIETELGRKRGSDRHASRPMDMDVVIYGDEIVKTANLVIPHPDVRSYRFVAYPLLELAPELILPDTKEPLKALKSAVWDAAMVPDEGFTRTLHELTGASMG